MIPSTRNTLLPAFAVFIVSVAGLLLWSGRLATEKVINRGNRNSARVACTQEAKLCPDGSAVGRTGPNCEFSICPGATTNGNVSGGCRITGCSRQVCADREVSTDCNMKPEYACYTSAICERQADGNCGWTATTTLNYCLTQMAWPKN